MPRPPTGPPPVDRSVAVRGESGVSKQQEAYLAITQNFRANSAASREIKAMLRGDKHLVERFLAVVFSSLQGDADLLLNATPMSIVQAILDAADLGLEPTGLSGEAAIVRYGNHATLLPMYRGYLKRIRNSGQVTDLDCQLVYSEDDFRLELGTNSKVHHIPVILEQDEHGSITVERGRYRGAYAWALMPSGTYIVEWMPTLDIEYIRQTFSRATDPKSPWNTSWGEMARKTPLRRLSKRLPQAAVDKLLILEARADLLARQEADSAAPPSVTVTTARRAALAAVRGEPAKEEAKEEPKAPEVQSEPPPQEIGW